jgi:hypothetical protein
MSSDYRLICLSHEQAEQLGNWQSLDGGRAAVVERLADRATEALIGHTGHEVIAGRYSYPLIEVYDPKAKEWISASWLALALAAYAAPGMSAQFAQVLWYVGAHEHWPIERLAPLRDELSHMLSSDVQAAPEHGADVAVARREASQAMAAEMLAHQGSDARLDCCHHLNSLHTADGCTAGWTLDKQDAVVAGCTCISRGQVTLDG